MKSSDPEAEADEVLKHVDNSKSGSINYTGMLFRNSLLDINRILDCDYS